MNEYGVLRDLDPHRSGSKSRRATMSHKNRKKAKKSHLKAEGFSCSLDVFFCVRPIILNGNICSNNINFLPGVNYFLQFFVIKPWIRDCIWIRIKANTDSQQCNFTNAVSWRVEFYLERNCA
jgi:hypothetical protein